MSPVYQPINSCVLGLFIVSVAHGFKLLELFYRIFLSTLHADLGASLKTFSSYSVTALNPNKRGDKSERNYRRYKMLFDMNTFSPH